MADNTGDAPVATGESTLANLADVFEKELNPTREGDSPAVAEGKPDASEPEDEADDAETDGEKSEEPDESDEEPDEQPARYRVKVADEEIEVTLDEALKGYSREADYTRKTQALAEEKKAFDAAKQSAVEEAKREVLQEREQYKAVLGIWEQQIRKSLGDEQHIEQLRASGDSLAYAQAVADRQMALENLGRFQAESKRLKDEDEQKTRSQTQRKLADEAGALLKAVPEWKDQAKYKSDMERLAAYGKSRGFSDADLQNISDHRVILAMRDAAAFRELSTKKPEPIRPVQTVKTVPPGVATQAPSNQSKEKKALARLKSTGKVDALADVFKLSGMDRRTG